MGDENLKPAILSVTPGGATYNHETVGFFAGPGMTHHFVN